MICPSHLTFVATFITILSLPINGYFESPARVLRKDCVMAKTTCCYSLEKLHTRILQRSPVFSRWIVSFKNNFLTKHWAPLQVSCWKRLLFYFHICLSTVRYMYVCTNIKNIVVCMYISKYINLCINIKCYVTNYWI